MKALTGYGAIDIIDSTNEALLLACATPGKSLKDYFPKQDQEATEIFCHIVTKLHQAPLFQNYHFPHIRDWLSALDKDYNLPETYLKKARILKEQLLKTAAPSVFLHGDLHHENILSNSSEWIVIDPKGVIGEPAYEIGVFIRNPMPNLLNTVDPISTIEKRIILCANLLKIDRNA